MPVISKHSLRLINRRVACLVLSVVALIGLHTAANAQGLKSDSLSAGAVVGGKSLTGKITLTAAAPSGGISITVASSNISAATVSSPVVVSAGATTQTFPITTIPVATNTTLTISAGYNGITRKATLTVQSPGVKSVAVKPTKLTGGASSTGTVTLNGPAPAGGISVALASGDISAATVNSPIEVAGGGATQTFTIATSPVSTTTAVKITASIGVSAKSATLTVQAPAVKSVRVTPASALGDGAKVTGTITLSGPAPLGGMTVDVSSSDTSVATVPTPVSVAAGTTTQKFAVTTVPVPTSTLITISAGIGGANKTAVLTLNPPSLKSFKVNPGSIAGGTGPATGTITLTGKAPAGGMAVVIGSTVPTAASSSTPVLVAASSTTRSFDIKTYSVATSTPVTISAVIGSASLSAPLTVNPAKLPQSFGAGYITPGGPSGIAIDPNSFDIYVGCWGSTGAVAKFDQYGNYLATFGTSGPGALKSGAEVAVDNSGNVYVGDYIGRDCVEFTKTGKYVQTFTGASSGVTLGLVTGVAVDSAGNVYVADDSNSRIVVFDKSGSVAYQFTIAIGAQGGGLAGVVGIALDPSQSNLWVTDYYYHGFSEYTLGGTLEAFYGNPAKSSVVEPGFFWEPYGIAVDSSDHVYVTDVYIDDIQEFDSSGNFIALQGEYGTGLDQFDNANGVAVDRHGDVLVSDGVSDSVTVFTPPF